MDHTGILSQSWRGQNCLYGKRTCHVKPVRAAALAAAFLPRMGRWQCYQIHLQGFPTHRHRWQEKSTNSVNLPAVKDCPAREIQSQKVSARRYKVKMTPCGKLLSAWHIFVAGTNTRVSCISRKRPNYLNSLTQKELLFWRGSSKTSLAVYFKIQILFLKNLTHFICILFFLKPPVLNSTQCTSHQYRKFGSEILPGYICKAHATTGTHPTRSPDPCISTEFGVCD